MNQAWGPSSRALQFRVGVPRRRLFSPAGVLRTLASIFVLSRGTTPQGNSDHRLAFAEAGQENWGDLDVGCWDA